MPRLSKRCMTQACSAVVKIRVGCTPRKGSARPCAPRAVCRGSWGPGAGLPGRAGAGLLGFAGGMLGLLGVAAAEDPGGVLVQRAGEHAWSECGAATSTPCTAERRLVLTLPAVQGLVNDRKALEGYRLIVEDQGETLSLFADRLSLCQGHAEDAEDVASDELGVLEDVLGDLEDAEARASKAEASVKSSRLVWFALGAAALAVVAGGGFALGAAL